MAFSTRPPVCIESSWVDVSRYRTRCRDCLSITVEHQESTPIARKGLAQLCVWAQRVQARLCSTCSAIMAM